MPVASPNRLADDQRLKRAKERTRRLVDHLSALFLMHEANSIVVYSSILGSQIPESYAAHAFNQFQRSMHLFEIGRLCALWDAYGDDRESIPTIADLIDKPEIIEAVAQETWEYFASQPPPHDLNPSDDPNVQQIKREWWDGYRIERADAEAKHARNRLMEGISKCKGITNSQEVMALRRFRNTLIAHNLDLGVLAKKSEVRSLRHGDEAHLLDATVDIADLLHLGLNGSSFDWQESRRIARRNAEALWNGCKFEVLH